MGVCQCGLKVQVLVWVVSSFMDYVMQVLLLSYTGMAAGLQLELAAVLSSWGIFQEV